jgi:hypothetical protein
VVYRGSRELVDAFLDHPHLRHRVRWIDPSLQGMTPLLDLTDAVPYSFIASRQRCGELLLSVRSGPKEKRDRRLAGRPRCRPFVVDAAVSWSGFAAGATAEDQRKV